MIHLEEVCRIRAIREHEGQISSWMARDEAGEIVKFAMNNEQYSTVLPWYQRRIERFWNMGRRVRNWIVLS